MSERSAPGSRSGNSPPATAASFRCSIARTNCSRSPARSRSPTSRKPRAQLRTAPTIFRWSKDRSPRRTTPSASAEVRQQSRHLVTIGACATAGGIQALRNFADVNDFIAAVYAIAAIHLDARDLDADLGPCAGRFRAARLPDQQGAAASR